MYSAVSSGFAASRPLFDALLGGLHGGTSSAWLLVQISVVSTIIIVITVTVMVILTIGMVIAIVIIVSAVPQGIGADGRAAAVLYPASLVLWALHAVMSSTASRFSPSVRPFTFYSVIKARKVIMKVKSAPTHQANWKRVRKS